MQTLIPEDFNAFIQRIHEPENLFSGLRLPNDFCLPNNVLIFYHPYAEHQQPQSHGRCTLVIPIDKMTYYVNRQKIELHPGDILFIPPYAPRFMYPDSHGFRRVFITFELQSTVSYQSFFGKNSLSPRAWNILKNFMNAYFESKPDETVVRLIDFIYSWERVELQSGTPKKISVKLEQALEYIQYHLEYVTDLWNVANHCDLSESHLRNLFKTEFGISAGKYIALQRMEAAKYLLRNTQLSINEIAMKTGFSNQFVFSTFFKRNIGFSPKKYRENQQK